MLADVKEMLREQLEFRELLSQMIRRDLLIRYKQSVMGFAWAVFMPLVNTVVFSVVFMRVAAIDVGMPYPLFAYCGLLTWNLFAGALRFSVISLTSNTSLVSKVYFPREIFPFSAVAVAVVDSAVGAVLLVGMMAYYHVHPTWAVFFLPVIVLVHVVLTAGVALLLAMSNLFYRDVKYLFEVAITGWMFATPVLYPLDGVGGTLGVVLRLNPMSPVIDAYRAVLFRGTLPPTAPFAASAVIAIAVLALGWLTFHRAESQFAENV